MKKKKIQFDKLTLSEARELGMQRWDGDLYLIPRRLASSIPEGLVVTDIFGKSEQYTSDFDKDSRFGMLAYGVEIKE